LQSVVSVCPYPLYPLNPLNFEPSNVIFARELVMAMSRPVSELGFWLGLTNTGEQSV